MWAGTESATISRMSWLLPTRLDTPELLDLGRGSPAEAAANLAEMWRINRYLGGLPALTRHLYPRLAAQAGLVTLADLGTGSADIPVAIVRWARSRGLKVRVFAVDWAARNLAVARSRVNGAPDVRLLRADAGCLPFAPESVDFVISSLFLHHLSPGKAVEVLRAAFARARRGIVMSDLVRGWLPYFAFKLIRPAFARSALTRHDGALSIRRAYTPAELCEIASAAGLPDARGHTHWPWRMTLVADRPPRETAG